MQYQVLRQHYGDKQYFSGDVREVRHKLDADYLIQQGLIAPLDNIEKQSKSSKKTALKPQNKMADDLDNKVDNQNDG